MNFQNHPKQIKLINHNSLFMIPNSKHVPVLLDEVIKVLDPKPGEFFIDGTAGAEGHTAALREKVGLTGHVLGIDWEKTGENYADLPAILESKKLHKADGLILDLGFSSEQIGGGRGFSFQSDEPLIMTYSATSKSVQEILKELSEAELTKIISEFGEESYAPKIAKAIKAAGRKKSIETTKQLAEIVKAAVPENYERGRIHPATRTFQALRIYANRELENLQQALNNLETILKPGARVAIISFHSLEDRIVKNSFRDLEKSGKLKTLTKKPIIATNPEIMTNPRSRSAKLRAAQLI
ncbi:MAG: 16S rRNA (cytosine1402-N4)-methyltransferase [Parcubacteria group bacterium Gr01-1014_3]|nr:MAG: 16S rRNA (cytosine1402-N4)-methyltransferase [Parcubacteria group bacterium Gr01-1014_3]